jgi:hypothetical protein
MKLHNRAVILESMALALALAVVLAVGTAAAAAPPLTPAAAAPAAAEPAPAAARPSSAQEQYDLKLRELQEKVVDLKEKIFRTKTRLLILKEQVLNDAIAEAKAIILHHNDMGGSFKLEQAVYYLDGEKIYFGDSSGPAANDTEVEVFSGNVIPGNHVLSVEMVYRGDSAVFAYLKDYLFKLRANFTFYATKGKISTVRSIGYLKGDITYDLTKRPSVQFKVDQVRFSRDAKAASDDKGAAPGGGASR